MNIHQLLLGKFLHLAPLRQRVLLTLFCTALLSITFFPVLADAVSYWSSHEEYSYGYLVVPLALFLSWHKLAEAPLRIEASWIGCILLLTAALLLLISNLSAFRTIGQYAFVIGVLGLVLAIWGKLVTRTVAACLLYLLFAIPLPYMVNAHLSQGFQLMSSTLGTALLRMMSIPVFQEGNIIDLGVYQLQVAEACNGLRYLFPLLSFGYLVTLLMEEKFLKRATLFLSIIPITIAMNALRIAVTGIAVLLGGRQMAEGFIHDFEGYTVFIACLLLLAAEVTILQRIPPKGKFKFDYLALPPAKFNVTAVSQKKGPLWGALLLSLSMAISLISSPQRDNDPYVPYHQPLVHFPTTLGEWKGIKQTLSREVLDTLHPTDYLVVDYRTPSSPTPVNLYIGWFEKQTMDAQPHSPSLCLSGSGWQISDQRTVQIQLPSAEELEVTRLRLDQAGRSTLVYYWFSERGRMITESSYAKLYLLLDALTTGRSDGAIIRFAVPILPDENESEAESRLRNFLNLAYPHLSFFIPGR